jgi:hypothetical protein
VVHAPRAGLAHGRYAAPEVYRIAGQSRNGCETIGATATSAKAALVLARQWVRQGIKNITITNPHGESYDLDRFGMIASTKEVNSSDAVGLKVRDKEAAAV